MLTLCAVALLGLAQFCEAGETVKYVNESDVALEANVVGEGSSDIPPHSTKSYGYIMPTDDPFQLSIVDTSGCVVYELDTTLEALKQEHDLRIVITAVDAQKCQSNS